MTQCVGRVWKFTGFRGCTRQAKVTRNGQDYCRQHDPVAVLARDEARERRHRALMTGFDLRDAVERAERAVIRAAGAWYDGAPLGDSATRVRLTLRVSRAVVRLRRAEAALKAHYKGRD